jgi:hypothetical protein
MRANIQERIDQIPGTTTVYVGPHKVAIVITDLQVFYTHAGNTIDLVEQRRLWILKQKR